MAKRSKSDRWNHRGHQLAAAVSAAAVLVALSACAPSTSDSPDTEANGKIVVAVPEEIPTLDPQAREFYGIQAIDNWNIFEGLLMRDDSGALQPWLASEEPTRIDDTTWQFKIREGVTFTNGESFNADAAAFSINRIIDPAYASEILPRLGTIESAVAVSATELNVVTKAPDPILPSRIELIMMVPPKAAADPGFATAPVGTGPYVWESGIGTGPIKLGLNDKYWGDKKPSISNIEFRVIPDTTTQLSALNAGEIDLIMRLGADAAKSVPQVLTAPGLENNVVTLNSTAGITADPKVRQALNYAVDKEALAKDLWSGYADVATCQAVAPSAFGYDKSLKAYPYNVDKAQELLTEAGVVGQTITLVTASGVFPQGQEMGQVIAQYWEAAGLKVDLQVPEFDPYLKALYAKGADRPSGVYLSTTTELGDADSVVQRIYVSGAQVAGYSNEKVDALAVKAGEEADPDSRARIYADLLKIGCDDAAAVFLLAPQELYGASDRLVFTPRADAKILFSDMSVKN